MNKYLKYSIFTILLLIILTGAYIGYQKYSYSKYFLTDEEVNQYKQNQQQEPIKETYYQSQQPVYTTSNIEITELEQQIKQTETLLEQRTYELEQYKNYTQKQDKEINELSQKVLMLNAELRDLETLYENATGELYSANKKLEYAEPIVDRYQRGINLAKYHTLLADYDDYAEPLILKYLGLSEPTAPVTEEQLWERAGKIYDWISARYTYCGDRGLRFGSSYVQFQFFSPDELLSVDNNWCGDCDDFATLFAGLMYASGVPQEKVYVVCGEADGGGHCWNWLSAGGRIRTIDTVCTQSKSVIDVLGHKLWEKENYPFPATFGDAKCFNKYDAYFWMSPDHFVKLNVTYN